MSSLKNFGAGNIDTPWKKEVPPKLVGTKDLPNGIRIYQYQVLSFSQWNKNLYFKGTVEQTEFSELASWSDRGHAYEIRIEDPPPMCSFLFKGKQVYTINSLNRLCDAETAYLINKAGLENQIKTLEWQLLVDERTLSNKWNPNKLQALNKGFVLTNADDVLRFVLVLNELSIPCTGALAQEQRTMSQVREDFDALANTLNSEIGCIKSSVQNFVNNKAYVSELMKELKGAEKKAHLFRSEVKKIADQYSSADSTAILAGYVPVFVDGKALDGFSINKIDEELKILRNQVENLQDLVINKGSALVSLLSTSDDPIAKILSKQVVYNKKGIIHLQFGDVLIKLTDSGWTVISNEATAGKATSSKVVANEKMDEEDLENRFW